MLRCFGTGTLILLKLERACAPLPLPPPWAAEVVASFEDGPKLESCAVRDRSAIRTEKVYTEQIELALRSNCEPMRTRGGLAIEVLCATGGGV